MGPSTAVPRPKPTISPSRLIAQVKATNPFILLNWEMVAISSAISQERENVPTLLPMASLMGCLFSCVLNAEEAFRRIDWNGEGTGWERTDLKAVVFILIF